MKKIVNRKMYNTDTATIVGTYEYLTPRDFDYVYETLHRKTTGEYFLHGEGGAKTIYATPLPNHGLTGGEDIRPMTQGDAMSWAREHLDADTYTAEFGAVSE